MSFLMPKAPDNSAVPPPPIPPTMANANVKNQSAQARAAAAAAAGKVNGVGGTVKTSAQGDAVAPQTASRSLLGA